MKKFRMYGMPPAIWLTSCAIIIASIYLGVLSSGIIGALAVCMTISSISMFVGNRIPIWKTYFGGGVLLSVFVGSSATYFGWLPQSTLDTVTYFIGANEFLNLFIIVVVMGSIMSLDRVVLRKIVFSFIPCILTSCMGAAILAVGVGMLFGREPSYTLAYFVLPIMSGGIGSGALPLGQLFAEITGNDFDTYISVAVAMLAIGDLCAVVLSAVIGKVVAGNPKLCGEGKLMREELVGSDGNKSLQPPNLQDLTGALLFILSIYFLGKITSTFILPSIAGAHIHMLAYVAIFTVVMKWANLVPENIVSAIIHTQKYMLAAMIPVIMFCCGLAYTDLGMLLSTMTDPVNLAICIAVALGALIGGASLGQFMGFYPYEAGVTSGLCMANAGSASDVVVLSACNRMNLLPYAQISSSIGNAIVLVLGSFVFTAMV